MWYSSISMLLVLIFARKKVIHHSWRLLLLIFSWISVLSFHPFSHRNRISVYNYFHCSDSLSYLSQGIFFPKSNFFYWNLHYFAKLPIGHHFFLLLYLQYSLRTILFHYLVSIFIDWSFFLQLKSIFLTVSSYVP